MNNLRYFAFFVLILAALISAIRQMSIALDEVDIERFTLWTSIASVIAGLPMMLW
ncbi:hypothetical protein I8748_16965 [Nostoc sp. CENA67]|uniref:Uncharacterized protein n=1 Tax=Amazonocrinis nigriterrae CENA67 TaxID=2794033 RepID=A0A8J7L938_9NOST|nr:hypothetical protein [Amazonocrinis nigriterrae]MBH8563860.1 hypothetical protein [Amazonocrinis nigriterrae CENA67]BAZ50446.1 hypothetical protein NIES4103_30620 [Nostoc sp. NIES-4103]